jgi:DNA-directed RNA polymerase specialized sigma24 family protein
MAQRQRSDICSPARPADPDLAAAAAGSQGAWDRLVERHAQRVWSTARGFGLGDDTAADVCLVAWARLVDHLDELSTDDEVRDWLSAATEYEARRFLCSEHRSSDRDAQRSARREPSPDGP